MKLGVLRPSTGKKRNLTIEREEIAIPVVEASRCAGNKLGYIHLLGFSRRRHAEPLRSAVGEAREARSGGIRARPARQRRRAAERGGADLEHVRSRGRRSSSTTRRAPRATRSTTRSETRSAAPDGRPDQSRHGFRGRDPRCGACRQRARRRSSARAPSAKAFSRRYRPLQRRRARPDGRRVLHRRRDLAGRKGIQPDVFAEDDPGTKPDEGLQRALAVLEEEVAGGIRHGQVSARPRPERGLGAALRRSSGAGASWSPSRSSSAAPGDARPAARAQRSGRRWRWSSSARAARGCCASSARRRAPATWSTRWSGSAPGRRGFRRKVEDAAREAATGAPPIRAARRDLTDLATFTVDPATARDFDDAVSAEREGDGVRLWIHIADVAAHVRPGTALDAEACRRANSTYVPGAVEPMLPHALSERRLQPRAGRRAPRRHRGDRARRRRRGRVGAASIAA